MKQSQWLLCLFGFMIYMAFPILVVWSMLGQSMPEYTVSYKTLATCVGLVYVPALIGYFIGRMQPVEEEDELAEESWRKKK